MTKDFGAVLCEAFNLKNVRDLSVRCVVGETPTLIAEISVNTPEGVAETVNQFEIVPKGTMLRLKELEARC